MKEKDLSKWSNGRKEKSFEIQSYLINRDFDNFIILTILTTLEILTLIY